MEVVGTVQIWTCSDQASCGFGAAQGNRSCCRRRLIRIEKLGFFFGHQQEKNGTVNLFQSYAQAEVKQPKSQEKDWNQKLLEGPAASSLKAVMLGCRKVVGSEENIETCTA